MTTKRSVVSLVVMAVMWCAAPAWAQFAPAWTRGLQLLPIPMSEASSRALGALEGEGYNVTNTSNPTNSDVFFAGGQKGPHSAIIMCDRSPDGKTWVNIVVATNGGDSGAPGLERQRLQARMDNPSMPPRTPTPTPTPTPPSSSCNAGIPLPIDWSRSPIDWRDRVGQRFTFSLPPGGQAKGCWGTDIYSDDTAIGSAAVHAGVITFERGGTVTIEMRPGLKLPGYAASSRNNVECRRWDGAPSSFVIVTDCGSGTTGMAAGGVIKPPANPPQSIPFPGYMAYAQRDELGKRYTFQCRAGEGQVVPANLYGTDVYTEDTGVCSAAVHSGLITFERGGIVTVEIVQGQDRYVGSTRYGVTSARFDYPSRHSFVFVR